MTDFGLQRGNARWGGALAPVPRGPDEFMEVLGGAGSTRVERIVSQGHASPEGFWYDQDEWEWVIVIQGAAELEFEGGRQHAMKAGDWIVIPPHERHRVARTSLEPPCVWIAVFAVPDRTDAIRRPGCCPS